MPMGEPQGREGLGSAVVIIGGQRYDRFLSLNLKRSIEESCCSGAVVLSWPGAEHFQMTSMVASSFDAGVGGAIMLDGQLAGTVVFDTRISKGTPKHYELTLQFRGQMAINVDSMPDHESGQFNEQKADQIIQQVMKGGSLEARGGGETIPRFIYSEGETIERMARRAAREKSFYGPWENPEGNWVISKELGGGGGGGDLKLGRDFTQWSVKADVSPRYNEYELSANSIPDDQKYGKQAEKVYGRESRDLTFDPGSKKFRMLLDTHHTQSSVQERAKFEANRRTAQGLNVTLKTSTWSDRGGKLWEAGGKYHVSIPVDEVDDTLVLTEVEFELTADSRSATLVLSSENAWGGGGPENVLSTDSSRVWDKPLDIRPEAQQGTQIPPAPGP